MIRAEQIAAQPGMGMRSTLDRPLDHLLACHRRIEERLAILVRAALHLDDRRLEALEVIGNCFRFLDSNSVWHTADEEESVFPRLAGRMTAKDSRFLRNLEAEHRAAERQLEELRSLYSRLVAGKGDQGDLARRFREGVARLCIAYSTHIAAEDSRLIPLAKRVLAEADLVAVTREMRSRRGLASGAGPGVPDPR